MGVCVRRQLPGEATWPAGVMVASEGAATGDTAAGR